MRYPSPILGRLVKRGGALGRMLVAGHNPRRQRWLTAIAIALVLAIGLLDYLIDNDDRISCRFFYCLAVMLAVTVRGWRFGVVIGLASVAVMTAGDLGLRLDYFSAFDLWWNAVISFSTYV